MQVGNISKLIQKYLSIFGVRNGKVLNSWNKLSSFVQ